MFSPTLYTGAFLMFKKSKKPESRFVKVAASIKAGAVSNPEIITDSIKNVADSSMMIRQVRRSQMASTVIPLISAVSEVASAGLRMYNTRQARLEREAQKKKGWFR